MSAQAHALWQLAPLGEAHLPEVLDVEQRAYEFPWTEQIFRDCLSVGYSAWAVLGARHEVLAYALMSMAVGEAHILNLCVDPGQQRRGIGRFLLNHLLQIARAAGMGIVLLEVRKSNLGAIAMYKSAGFRRLGERRGYYPAPAGREDAWLFGLELA